MAGSNDEVERLKRLRDEQLHARDPQKKQRKVQQTVTRKYRARQTDTLGDLIDLISHKWRGLIIGVLLGLATWILLAIFVQEAWVDLVGILALVILPLMGVVLGGLFDWRDNLRDF